MADPACADAHYDGKLAEDLTGNGDTNAKALANLDGKVYAAVGESPKAGKFACTDYKCADGGSCEPYIEWDEKPEEKDFFTGGFRQKDGSVNWGQGITKKKGSKFKVKCHCLHYKCKLLFASVPQKAERAASQQLQG